MRVVARELGPAARLIEVPAHDVALNTEGADSRELGWQCGRRELVEDVADLGEAFSTDFSSATAREREADPVRRRAVVGEAVAERFPRERHCCLVVEA